MREKAWRRDKARDLDHVAHFTKRVFDEWPLKNGETVRVSTDYLSCLPRHLAGAECKCCQASRLGSLLEKG
jgi:hypothetical protein